MKKLTEKQTELLNKISDLIGSNVHLRDVPYSMEEGAMEVDPDSIDDAAMAVVDMLSSEVGDRLTELTKRHKEVMVTRK